MNNYIENPTNPFDSCLNNTRSYLLLHATETTMRKMKQFLMIAFVLMTMAATFLPTPVWAGDPPTDPPIIGGNGEPCGDCK